MSTGVTHIHFCDTGSPSYNRSLADILLGFPSQDHLKLYATIFHHSHHIVTRIRLSCREHAEFQSLIVLINTRPTLAGFNMNEQQRGSSAFERSSDCTGISKNQHAESERRPSWRGRGSESPALRRQSSSRTRSFVRAPEHKQWWKFTLRPWDDDQEQNWWFAGTAIPLLAATIGMCKRDDIWTRCPWPCINRFTAER